MKRTLTLVAAATLALIVTAKALAVGELTQKVGTAACVSYGGTGGVCQDGNGLDAAQGVVVSTDGKSVYVASYAANAVAVLDRDPATGALVQKAGVFGCLSQFAGLDGCQHAVALSGATDVAASRDGKSVYVASVSSDALAILDRDPATGALAQKPPPNGCVSLTGGCRTGLALDAAAGVAVSPDGKSVYAGSNLSDAVVVFDRDPATGALTQKPPPTACISQSGTGGACQTGKALDAAVGVAVTRDGKSVYVASFGSDAVAIFDRDPATGALVQKAGRAGCVSDDGTGGACEDGKALKGATRLATSTDGTSVYVGSANSDAVAVFDRDPASGALVQKAGAAGCVSEDGTGGACQNGKALVDARSVAVAPDGDSVYVASQGSDAVAVFARNRATGALTQKPGAAGCLSETSTNGACRDGAALDEAYGVAASPDGKSVYAASVASDAVAILDRTMPPTASSPGADTLRPTVSGFTVTPRRFRVARKATAIDAARRGAQFRFRLSEAASSRIVIDRALPGRTVGRRCRPATHRLRRHRRCTRFTRAGTLRRANRPAGLTTVPFSGRIAKRALAPGHYRATTTATDRAGNVSQPRRLRLRIVRR